MDSNKIQTFIDLCQSEDWVCVDTQKDHLDHEFVLWERPSEMEFPMVKCTGILPCSAKEAFEWVCNTNMNKRKKWDLQVAKYKIVHKFDDNNCLLHYVYRAPFPVKSRDFCTIRHTSYKNNQYILCGVSVEDDRIPVSSKYVRGEVFYAGYLVKELGEDQCSITSLTHVDVKGWIPSFVVKLTKTKQLLKYIQLSKTLSK